MKNTSVPFFVLTASILLLVGCTTANPAHATATQWEYKIARDDNTRSETPEVFLNNLGQEGWVLVQHENGRYIFKRPKK